MPLFRIRLCAIAFVIPFVSLGLWPSQVLHGQATGSPAEPPKLPSASDQWLNSSPLTYESLRGKGVVLYYFEETCPTCAGRWPSMLKTAQEHADEPLLFVAVNSGSDPRQLSAYLKKHNVNWPVIVDPDRSFEKASGVKEISLQSILDVRVIKPDGTFTWGRWNDIPATAKAVTEGATWKVKYDKLHPSMHDAVRRMEFGDYRPAAVAIRKGLKDRDPAVQRAAQLVNGEIQKRMQQSLDKALGGVPADDRLAQFEAREQVAQKFSPHRLPDQAAKDLERLRQDPLVRQEQSAAKAVDANEADLASPDEAAHQRAVLRLERVVKGFPNTRGAARAKQLLASAGAKP